MGDIQSCCQQNLPSTRDDFLHEIVSDNKTKKINLTPFIQMPPSIRATLDEVLCSKYARGAKRERKEQDLHVFPYESSKEQQATIYIKSEKTAPKEMLHGYYTLYLPSEQYFEGIFEQNRAVVGALVFKGGYYVGDIRECKAHGMGAYVTETYRYEGEWECSLSHGHGTQVYANGDTYQGEFVFGVRFNQGKYLFADHKVYEGQFYNGLPEGGGQMTWQNGNYYVGDWHQGRMEGKGKYVWANGETYEGDFLNGLKHGQGKYVFNRDIVYQGGWENGKQSGNGVLKQALDQIVGVWRNGLRIDNQL